MMKNNILWLLLAVYITACNHNGQQSKKNSVKPSKTDEAAVSSAGESHVAADEAKSDTLIALTVVDASSKNVYKKYGIDFSGFCYACDAADIVIGNRQIILVNTCDRKIIESFPVLSSSVKKDGMTFTTRACTFEFKWIEAVPVYELKISGKLKQNENLRINRYFTVSQAIPKFEVHDCGDFQG